MLDPPALLRRPGSLPQYRGIAIPALSIFVQLHLNHLAI